jgi:ATP/maltotriose-dependent transcriptional regulator MalT
LILAGRYDEAANSVEEELRIIRDYGLDFALPHALTLQGVAHTGMRRFADAQRSFNQVERLARASGDEFSLSNLGVQRVRLHLCKGEVRSACDLAANLGSMPTRGTQGELLAARALGLAAAGDVDLAEALVSEPQRLTRSVETEHFVRWTRVISALQTHDESVLDKARTAFDRVVESGCVHPFVCAYRGFPAILGVFKLDGSRRDELVLILTRAHDATIARSAGLAIGEKRVGNLSKRESEVLALLAEGLSNRAIAARLFISEVTVKVHVRRIFEKLRVRSRTEAALVAAGRLDGDGEF